MPTDSMTTKKKLLQQLRAAAGPPSYSEEALRQLLITYLDQTWDPENLYHTALNLSRLDADSIFNQLEAGAIDMVSVEDLIRWIRKSDHRGKMNILALLEGMELSGSRTGTNKEAAIAAGKEKGPGDQQKTPWSPYAIVGGIALLIFLVWLDRKRKRQKKQN